MLEITATFRGRSRFIVGCDCNMTSCHVIFKPGLVPKSPDGDDDGEGDVTAAKIKCDISDKFK